MRRDGEQYIQTLKSRGQSVAGLSERNEWDWYLEKNKLDLKKLDDKCWPAALKDLDKKQLKPIFSTDFVRQRAEIAWGRGKARVVVEAALDLGKVVAGDNQEEICELELELRQGDAAALLELAAELAADLPLMPCDISKAERGYRLFDPNSYEVDPRPRNCWRKPRWTVPSPPSPGTCSAAASDWPNSIASTATGACWRTGCNTCRTCAPCSGSLGQAVPRASSRELREALDALLADWAPRIERGRDDEMLRQQAPQLFRGELDETRWGLFSLNTSRWLLAKAWTESRNERGNRQGSAALGKWLLRSLAEEAQATPLARAHQHPELLPDQAPRLQRMLTWLRLARGVLDLPEADRLYGELAKLLELLRQPVDAERLAARAAQAHTVLTLKPWKALMK